MSKVLTIGIRARTGNVPETKSAREISLRAQLCDDLTMRQGGQLCQRGFLFVC